MTRRLRIERAATLLLAFAVSACGSGLPNFDLERMHTTSGGHTLVERLAAEAQGLSDLFRIRALIELGIVLAVMAVLVRAISVGVKLAWRLGLDGRRRLGWWENASRVLSAVLVLYLVARRAAAAAPIISAFGFIVMLAAASWVLSGYIQNTLVGVGLVLRRRIRGGDRIMVGEHSGIVQRVGIGEVELRKPDGAIAFVPNRMLSDGVLTVAWEKNTVPVRVRLVLGSPADRSVTEEARRVAVLSPYRAPGSSVEVGRDPSEEHVLVVQVQAWSEHAARQAGRQLEAALRVALADRIEARKASA